MVIADTDADARDAARPAYELWFDHLALLWRENDVPFPLPFPPSFDAAVAVAARVCLVGSSASVRDAILSETAESGVNYVFVASPSGTCRWNFAAIGRAAGRRGDAGVPGICMGQPDTWCKWWRPALIAPGQWCMAQLSGWEPSMSVKPYSWARSADVTERWFQRARPGSAASAATARPTYRGDSEEPNPSGAVG